MSDQPSKRNMLTDIGEALRTTFVDKPVTWVGLGNETTAQHIYERNNYNHSVKEKSFEYRDKKPHAFDALHHVDSAVRGIANAVTLGAADKLEAQAEASIMGESYDDRLARQQSRDADGGLAYIAGSITGSIVTGKAVAGAVASGAVGIISGLNAASKSLKTSVIFDPVDSVAPTVPHKVNKSEHHR